MVFGYRDAEEQAEYGSQQLPATIKSFDLAAIRQRGIAAAAREAVAHVSRDDLAGFWIHIDADCLDDAVMPAVEYRIPDGLTENELQTTLKMALDSGRAVGLEITVYNPALDADGRAGRALSDLLANALSQSH